MWSAARCEATVFASDSPRTKREAVASSETKCLQIDKTAGMMDTRSPTRGARCCYPGSTNSVTLKVLLDVWCCWWRRRADFWNSWITGVPECSSILIQVFVGSVFAVLSTCPGKRFLVFVRIDTHTAMDNAPRRTRRKLRPQGCLS